MASINILLVDDDIRNLTVLEAILDAPDYRVLKASSADEALRILMEQDCAAIVMDVKMPDMNGLELAQLIKQRRKTQHIPILFLTAHYYEERHVVLGYDAGAVDYITKPVHPAVLRSKIAVFVELFRKTAELARLNAAMEAEILDRQKAEERWRLVVEAAPHAKIVLDAKGRIIIVNSRTETLFGYSRGELLGEPLQKLLTRGLPPEWLENIAATERQPSWELTGQKKEGASISLEAVFSSFQSGDGHCLLVSLADITRRKQAEAALRASNEELALKNAELLRSADERARRIAAEAARAEAEAANRAKDHFLAMLSHELRTPLSPVLHAVALIEEEHHCPPAAGELLETIRRNVQLEARLIDDLLDLARIRNGKLQLNLEKVDAHDLFRRAVEICQPDIQRQELEARLNFSARRCWLHADPARIQQIFWNLITNAIKYSGKGGTLTFSTFDDENGRIRVEVADTGIGIAPERLAGIFDAFEQAMHGGTIEARSDGEGKGSTFTVRLPAIAEVVRSAEPKSPALQKPWPSLRILLVEDHADTAAHLMRLLRNRGYEVVAADSVASAMAMMKTAAADVLLSDIGLPDGQGLELMPPFLKEANGRRVAGIALSGYGMPEDVRRSRAAGFTHHVTKPVDISQLEKTLTAIAQDLTTP
jgi:PAS domain S-box-containing protein